MDAKKLYRCMGYIYECARCGQRFPVWMVSDSDWKKGIKAMRERGIRVKGEGLRFKYIGTGDRICKPCYEDFNPNPRYMTFDEYIAVFHVDSPKEAIDLIREVWELPSEYTEEDRRGIVGGKPWTAQEEREFLVQRTERDEEIEQRRKQFSKDRISRR